MFAKSIENNSEFQELLYKSILETRKNNCQSAILTASNAITILNLTYTFSFVGRDFSFVKIPYAYLSHGNYDSANFMYADLSNVDI